MVTFREARGVAELVQMRLGPFDENLFRLWLVIGRRVFGLMTLIREITYGLDIIVRPHLPQ